MDFLSMPFLFWMNINLIKSHIYALIDDSCVLAPFFLSLTTNPIPNPPVTSLIVDAAHRCRSPPLPLTAQSPPSTSETTVSGSPTSSENSFIPSPPSSITSKS
ncbi:hypothetical protein L6452_18434 [Arctium lappa]|uniref:Uncharacterized protein n=1 Tax=Arctium lappa TaxID=4217 RepID=A0ACB9C6H5_ARCLA|nr:hypothetical protein L6452_18434 [Arctium lappa]